MMVATAAISGHAMTLLPSAEFAAPAGKGIEWEMVLAPLMQANFMDVRERTACFGDNGPGALHCSADSGT